MGQTSLGSRWGALVHHNLKARLKLTLHTQTPHLIRAIWCRRMRRVQRRRLKKKVRIRPSSHSHGNLKKKQTTARGDKNRRKERGNEYFGTADPWAAPAESTYGPMSRPYSREASYNHRGFWDWSR